MSETRLGRYLKGLADGRAVSQDPFDEDYFDRREYEARRLEDEPRVIEEAMAAAKLKGEKLERERNTAGNRALNDSAWR